MELELLVGNGKWRLDRRCCEGGFGQVFFGKNTKTSEEVAIKLEKKSTPTCLK